LGTPPGDARPRIVGPCRACVNRPGAIF